MLSLDDDDLIAERPVGRAEVRERRSFNPRPLLAVLVVAILGGGLGVGAYWLSNVETKDVIGLLDVADQPHLTLPIPPRPTGGALSGDGESQAAPPSVTAPAGLFSPPGAVTSPSVGATHPHAGPDGGKSPAQASAIAPAPEPDGPSARDPAQAPTYASLPDIKGEVKPLPAAPIDALLRKGAAGMLPVIAKDGRQPWRVYARPFDGAPGKPKVAVVVTDLGLDRDATQAAITKLPAEVTLAFSPYAGGLDEWVKKARTAGHEVMLMLPAENVGFPARDPGPWGLLSNSPPEQNIARLEVVLARTGGYVGVLAPDGGFTSSPQLAPVLGALRERGLLYVGGGAKPDSGPPVAAVTTRLQVDLFRDAIEAQLAQAAQAAVAGNQGVVAVAPKPVTFDSLVKWFDKLGSHGVALAPVSAVVKQSGKS